MQDGLRVLVPLDGSKEAESALALAVSLSKAGPSRLTLFRVTPPDSPSAAAVDYLVQARDSLLPPGVSAEIRAECGSPAGEILWLARTNRFDLIVMTTHGRSGLRRLFGGSVAEEVVRKAALPVLLNRPGAPTPTFSRFVVPLDGSSLAEGILPDAIGLAKRFGAELHLFQATLQQVLSGGEGCLAGEACVVLPPPDPTPYLSHLAERARREGVTALPVVRFGEGAAEILRYAEDIGAGLICLTTHGRSGVARVILGSAAEKILRHAPCPVYVRRALKAAVPAAAEASPTSVRTE